MKYDIKHRDDLLSSILKFKSKNLKLEVIQLAAVVKCDSKICLQRTDRNPLGWYCYLESIAIQLDSPGILGARNLQLCWKMHQFQAAVAKYDSIEEIPL